MMDKLCSLLKKQKCTQSMYKRTSESELSRIASRCNRDEVAAIHIKLKLFRSELAACPDWDGDTQDMIWDAIETHKRLLAQIELLRKHRTLLTSAE